MPTSELALVLKAISDENRLRILQLLSQGEKCACLLLDQLQITQPTLSHHMKILCDAGLVTAQKDGRWMHYTLCREHISRLSDWFAGLLTPAAPPVLPAFSDGKARLFLFTGFLGSGKTTLLTRLLEALPEKRIGVIQNEFGRLGIDGTILGRDSVEMIEINRGSIFCSCLKLSFVQALADMAARQLDYLFVESSGLGDPSNIAEILEAVKVLAGEKYTFGGSLCLVDGAHFLEQLDDLETVYRQIKHCHLAVITKVDLITPEQLELVRTKVRECNPCCAITVSSMGNLSPAFLTRDLLEYTWATPEETTNSEETKPKTLTLTCASPIPAEKLDAFLEVIAELVYRVKGFLTLESLGWQQIDLVGHRIDKKSCSAQDNAQLVLISRVGPALIKPVFAAWEECVGLPMELKN